MDKKICRGNRSFNFKNYRNRNINENYTSFQKRGKKEILDKHNIDCEVIVSNVDEDEVKVSLLAEGADQLLFQNLAEIKSIKVSGQNPDRLVLGADSEFLNNEVINKPKSREEAFDIIKDLTIQNII